MSVSVQLSSCRVAPETGILRDCPRPEHLRNATFAERFDWNTLFYDVYQVDRYVVFQGPPFFNFLPLLCREKPLSAALSRLWPQARHVGSNKRGEIWLRSTTDNIELQGPLGRFDINVQPDQSDLFAGRRVLLAISKNNDPQWISDWLRFYSAIHKADALLLYDNGSTDYSHEELESILRAEFPELLIVIVPWNFPYGPSGGLAGAVDGIEAPWDSDFCQTGMFQHARFRFLRKARSVLNIDIDELVLSERGRSIFDATETSRSGFVKFAGYWITATTPHGIQPGRGYHADFWLRDTQDESTCPPKWCLVPARTSRNRHSWSVHNLFGARRNKRISSEFAFRHMRGISKGWKEVRWDASAYDPARFVPDTALRAAFDKAAMPLGADAAPSGQDLLKRAIR